MRAARRGGNWESGSNAQSGFYLNLNNVPSNVNTNNGFRAALGYGQKSVSHGVLSSAQSKGIYIPVALVEPIGKISKQVTGSK